MDLRVLPDPPSAAAAAARTIALRLRRAVRTRGAASLAVSGGSTPAAMFDVLATLDVPWRAVRILQVDERVAPVGSRARNATQLAEHLLDVLRGPRPEVHLLPVEDPDRVRVLAAACATVERLHPLDIVHLGVGDDGHTASWPPGSDVAARAEAVAAVDSFAGHARMTLTARIVNGARSRVALITGGSKADVVAAWWAGCADLPVCAVRRTRTMLVLDASAAVRLGHPGGHR